MTITNGYCTLAEAKARLWPTGAPADTSEDTMLEDIITASSRKIDDDTHRRFYVSANDETRTFSTHDFDCMKPGDLVSITALKTDIDGDGTFETTWAATDYSLAPFNASANGWPYTRIQVNPYGQYSFPVADYKSIQIIGKFGFPSVPAPIKEACLTQCLIMYQTKNLFGGMGRTNQTMADLENQYTNKISTYQRHL